MQEEVENRTVTLIVSGTRFSGNLLKAAISKYMAHRKEKKQQKSRMPLLSPKASRRSSSLWGKTKVFPIWKSPTRLFGSLRKSPESMVWTMR